MVLYNLFVYFDDGNSEATHPSNCISKSKEISVVAVSGSEYFRVVASLTAFLKLRYKAPKRVSVPCILII